MQTQLVCFEWKCSPPLISCRPLMDWRWWRREYIKLWLQLPERSAVHALDEEWLSAAFVLLKSGRFYTAPVIDCFMSHQGGIRTWGEADLNLCSAQQWQPLIWFLVLWTAPKTPLSHWLMLRGLWIQQALWLDFRLVGEQPFLWLRPSFMRGHGGEARERNTGQVVLVALLSVSDLSLHMLALKLYFPGQRGKHTKTTWQCSLFIFRLNWAPFSFSAAADYDVHSLLSARLWLASNQRPPLHCHSPCSRSPDHSRALHCFFTLAVACFLLFVVWLPAYLRQTKPDLCFWSGSVSTLDWAQTWIRHL